MSDSANPQHAPAWKTVFHRAETPMLLIDPAGKILDANLSLCELLQRPCASLLSTRLGDLASASDHGRTTSAISQIQAMSGRGHMETGLVRADGGEIHVRLSLSVFVGLPHRPTLVEIREIIGHAGPGERLFESHDLLRQILDKAPWLLFVRDLENRYVMVNHLYQKLAGLPQHEIIGRTPFDIFPESAARNYSHHDEAVLRENRPLHFEEESNIRGEKQYWLAMKMPIHDASGQTIGIAGMSTNITARKRAEEDLLELNATLETANHELRTMQELLIQAEKMESIGRLAAGVAHEVKNPLAMILMGLEYLRQLPADIDPHYCEILDEMARAVDRADRIVRGMVDFSANRQLDIQPVDVNECVRQVLPFIRHDSMRASVAIVEDFAEDLPKVALDIQRFEQVLLNLIINALHAMRDSGGTLRLWTRSGLATGGEPTDPGSRAADRLRTADPVVLVGVEDTGHGIAQADLDRIFDPFYTTKPTGEGTGLGLSICRKIIELHGGRLTARSRVGTGTTMTITLRACGNPG